jgi:hypothetical protein
MKDETRSNTTSDEYQIDDRLSRDVVLLLNDDDDGGGGDDEAPPFTWVPYVYFGV